MTTLSLADNKIVTMDPSVFVNVNVSDLDVSHNRIQSLHPVLLSSLNRTLRSLKIGGNRLQASHLWSAVLSPGVGLNLRVLDVSDMALGPSDQHFQLDLFSFQKHLKSLNVSGTQLDLLPVEMVRSLPALKELDLSRNQLTSLTDETVHVLASLLHLVTNSSTVNLASMASMASLASMTRRGRRRWIQSNPISSDEKALD